MINRERYTPGPAFGADVLKEGDKWTLVLVRDLRHAPEKVWEALTDPAQLREWAPFVANDNMGAAKKVELTWVGTPAPVEATVTKADAPNLLEYDDIRWELTPFGSGTRLTLWHKIDRRYIAWGAAGWHICFDVLDSLLDGHPLGRIAGADAMRYDWQRLNGEYATQFGADTPGSKNE